MFQRKRKRGRDTKCEDFRHKIETECNEREKEEWEEKFKESKYVKKIYDKKEYLKQN